MSLDKKFWKGKKVFLTGHTGFKGSWMAQWLLQLGSEVYGYSLAPNTSPSHYELLKLNESLEESIADIRDYESLKSALHQFQPDIVFHLAAQPLVRLSYESPIDTYSTNVMGTVNLLNACRSCDQLGAVVVITTDKCYKNNEWVWPYRETDTLGGFDPYSNSKACAELVVDCYRHSFFQKSSSSSTPQLASARAGNVVGGGDWALDRLIPDIMRAYENQKEMVVRSPQAVRPWQHVLDPLYGYILLAQALYGNNTQEACFNFGPNHQDTVTVLDILKLVKSTLGEKFQFRIEENNTLHEAHLLKLDSSKAISTLKWTPHLSKEDTIQMTVNWYEGFFQSQSPLELTQSQIQHFESLIGSR